MIEYCTGSIFDSGCEALVNPVNCVGVMGAGLAKQFKERFPFAYQAYKSLCEDGYLEPGGTMYCTDNGVKIIALATKDHWKDNSELEFISEGLYDLSRWLNSSEIHSIAIPALGCGLGGLDWNDVKPLIEEFAENLPDVFVKVYPPQ